MLTSLRGSEKKPSLRVFQLQQSTEAFTHSSDFVSTKRPGGAGDHVGGRQNKAGTRCVGSQLTWKKKSHCFISLTLPSMASWSSPSQRHTSVHVLESMALSLLCHDWSSYWTYAANVLAADESFAFCYNKIQALTCVVSYLGQTDGSPAPLLMKLEVKISLLSCSVTRCVWCLCSSAGGAGADTPGCIHSEKQ